MGNQDGSNSTLNGWRKLPTLLNLLVATSYCLN